MAVPRLPTAVEMKIVALIARGDKYEDIRKEVERTFDRTISPGVITHIKKRNSQALATIKEAIIQKEKDDAQGLLARSHRLIGKKLRDVEQGKDDVKISDLTAISKEMFHQTRVEQGLDPETAKLTNPKEKLKELQELLEENDEVRLERIVFAKRDATTEVYPLPAPAGGDGGDQRGGGVQEQDIRPGADTDAQESQTQESS